MLGRADLDGSSRAKTTAPNLGGNSEMAGSDPQRSGDEPERMPFFQRLLDNPFLLLFLGVTMPTVLYLIWGIMEIIQIPIAHPE